MAENGQRKLAIICSKGTLDMALPGLILANSARMVGVEVMMFFTLWGMNMITKAKVNGLKVTPVGNPAMGMPNLLGVLPGVSAMATTMMKKELDRLDVPPVDEFLEMVHDAGAQIYACKLSVDMMKLSMDDFVPQVDAIVNAMDFIEKAEGAQIIFV